MSMTNEFNQAMMKSEKKFMDIGLDIKIENYETEVSDNVELPKGGIDVYFTLWCPDFRKAREWLNERNF